MQVKNICNKVDINGLRPITKCISNKRFSRNSSSLPRSDPGFGRQESSPQSLTAATLVRYQLSKP